MRRRGVDESAILAALLDTNRKRCAPPLDDGEVEKLARSISQYAPEPDARPGQEAGGSDGGDLDSRGVTLDDFRAYMPVQRFARGRLTP